MDDAANVLITVYSKSAGVDSGVVQEGVRAMDALILAEFPDQARVVTTLHALNAQVAQKVYETDAWGFEKVCMVEDSASTPGVAGRGSWSVEEARAATQAAVKVPRQFVLTLMVRWLKGEPRSSSKGTNEPANGCVDGVESVPSNGSGSPLLDGSDNGPFRYAIVFYKQELTGDE